MKDYEFINYDDSRKVVMQIEKTSQELGGHTYTSWDELMVLYELARNACFPQTEDGCIFECGTWFGISAMVMAQGLKESRLSDYLVFTVDAYPPLRRQVEGRLGLTLADAYPVYKKGYEKRTEEIISEEFDYHDWQRRNPQQTVARSLMHSLELADYIVAVVHDSVRYLKMFNLPIRLAFIDSSHDVATCYNEALLIKEKLVPGGTIVFHDSHFWQVETVIEKLIPDEDYEVHESLAIWRP